MKAIIAMLKGVVLSCLFGIGTLILLWGIFCFLGGPDPGAGSGHEGFKFGVMFTSVGLAMIFLARFILKSLRPKGDGEGEEKAQ